MCGVVVLWRSFGLKSLLLFCNYEYIRKVIMDDILKSINHLWFIFFYKHPTTP